MEVQGDADLVFISMRESQLEGPKQASSPGYHRAHESKFPKYSLSFLDADSVLGVMEVLKDVKDPVFALLGKLQCALTSVQCPA